MGRRSYWKGVGVISVVSGVMNEILRCFAFVRYRRNLGLLAAMFFRSVNSFMLFFFCNIIKYNMELHSDSNDRFDYFHV